MADLDFKVSYTLKWGGEYFLKDIRASADKAVKDAITIYFWELYRTLNAHWGSIQIYSYIRKAVTRSAPGQPPFVQTQNLGNSLNVAYGAKARSISVKEYMSLRDTKIGCVYTDVPYARVLEFGGLAKAFNKEFMRYTKWILINPIRRSLNIAARPAWRPAYSFSVGRMINATRLAMRNGIKTTYVK